MKNIIAPTDFSQNALNAVLVAYSLSKRANAKLNILHCYRPFHSAFQPSQANEQDTARVRLEAEEQMKQLRNKMENLGLDTGAVQFVCTEGNLTDVLSDISEETPIDLIVMGTMGASGIKYHFLGSKTYEVAQEARFPLLVVPIGVTHFKLENIAFLTDFHPGDHRTLTNLNNIFGQEGIHYHLVHIVEEETADAAGYERKLDDWATKLREATGVMALETQVINEKENIEAVAKLAEQQQTDLLALTMAERSFWDRLQDKSLAKAIIMQSKVPVFVTN